MPFGTMQIKKLIWYSAYLTDGINIPPWKHYFVSNYTSEWECSHAVSGLNHL